MRLLNDLLKKNVVFEWKEAQQHAFDTLKEKFTAAPVLAYPDNDCQFCLECDASNYTTGVVLSILEEDKWHPVAYHSHSMSSEERNYLIADKDVLSVIKALEIWRHYLKETKHEFKVWNDHQNLQWFMMEQDLNRRQARWAQYLSRFNLKWLHKAGVTMGKADALSRCEDHMIGIEDDNKGVLVILPEHIRQNQVLICNEDNKIHKKIKEATSKLLESEVFTISKDWKEEDGVIMKDKQMYIPDKEDLWLQVVKLHRDILVAGHPGYEKMIELLQRAYFWPGMTSFIKDYISRYDGCTRFKGMNQAPSGILNPLEAPHMPWVDVTADFTTDLPLLNRYDSILVIVDRFSKEVEFIPMTKTVTALETTKLYLFNMWKNHGLPCSIISDRGPQFAS